MVVGYIRFEGCGDDSGGIYEAEEESSEGGVGLLLVTVLRRGEG